jgi:hypothetical protein
MVAKIATGEVVDDRDSAKNASAVALGKLGGSKGGKARAEKLSARRRSQIAKAAALARYSKKP